MKKMYLGFNTNGNNQSNGRTTNAVMLGKLRNTPGSNTRKFKYCNKNSPNLKQTFQCVFDISSQNAPKKTCYYQENAYWATFRGSSTNFYGETNVLGPTSQPSKKYEYIFNTQGTNDSGIVLDKYGNVYCTNSVNTILYCFDSSLNEKWTFNPLSSYPGGLYLNPLISCDGTVYFTCAMDEANTQSKLFAINPITGQEKWNVSLEGGLDLQVVSNVIGNNGNIIATTSIGKIYVVDQNGIKLREFDTNYNLCGWNASIDVENNLFFINGFNLLDGSDIKLFIVNLNTREIKSAILPGLSYASTPVHIGNFVYQCTDSGIYKFDKFTGLLVASNTNYILMGDNSPIVDSDGNIYVGTSDQGFIKFDKDLNRIWNYSYNQSSNFNAGSAIISQNKYIYLCDYANGKLICIDKNGTNPTYLWDIDYSEPFSSYSTPAIGKNGYIYVATNNGVNFGISAFGI